MYTDDRGDMGFMESMVALIAVITVLTCYLGTLAGTTVIVTDPTDGLDPDRFTGTIVDGAYRPGFDDYLETFIEVHNHEGVTVRITVPGGYCEDVTVTFGEMVGNPHVRTFTAPIPMDDGRVLTGIFEVTLCV